MAYQEMIPGSKKVVDDRDFTTDVDFYSQHMKVSVRKNSLSKKEIHQISRISLNVEFLQGLTEETTTQNGAMTERTDHTDLTCPNLTLVNSVNQTPCSSSQTKQHSLSHPPPQVQEPPISSVFHRLSLIFKTLCKLIPSLTKRLLTHLSKTSTADKYLRLIYSIFKLYRALNEKNNLAKISKEILTARRIIQWETKYGLAKELKSCQMGLIDFGYKTFQLFGNLFDFASLWIHMLAEKNQHLEQLSETLNSWQDDCYFYQCLIQLILSVKNLIKNLNIYRNEKYLQTRKFETLHLETSLIQAKDQLHKKYNRIKQLSESTENTKTQMRKILLAKLSQKIDQKQEKTQKILNQYQAWQKAQKQRVKKETMKSGIKVLKYICDVRTSYNNYSWKNCGLDPVYGGILSIFSSLLSMSLIWNF